MKFKYLAFIGLLPICFQSYAADFNYNTLQISVGSVQPSDDGENGTGIGLSGTVELGNIFYAGAGISSVDFDRIDQTVKMLGIGVHGSLGKETDVYAQIFALQADIEIENYGSFDDSGQGVTLGLRHMATEKVELTGGVEHTDIFDDKDTAPFVGAYYYLKESANFGFVVSKPDDATSYVLSLRINF